MSNKNIQMQQKIAGAWNKLYPLSLTQNIFDGNGDNVDDIIALMTKKAGNVVHVKDYGAKCDGSTDDASAIQACINAVEAGTTILLGNSRLHSQLIVNKMLTFKGDNYVNGNYSGAYPSARLLFPALATVTPCIVSSVGKRA